MIAIIKYNAGNITSVKNAIERFGFECIVTDNEQQIRNADKVILPGVGEASSAMSYLKERMIREFSGFAIRNIDYKIDSDIILIGSLKKLT